MGARRHYAVPRALHNAGLLQKVYTDTYIGNKPWLGPIIQAVASVPGLSGARRFIGRNAPDLPPGKVISFDLLGLCFIARSAMLTSKDMPTDIYANFAAAFGRRVVEAGFGSANAVYGFNGASAEIFAAAKKAGLRCILDQTVVPMPVYRDLMRAEIDRWPGWQPGLLLEAAKDPLTPRDIKEWELADLIICGSEYLAKSIGSIGGPVEKCHVVPYGFELPANSASRSRRADSLKEGIRLLFVGEVGLRKGAPYLLEALRRLKPGTVLARFAGPLQLDAAKAAAYSDVAEFLGHLPRDQMAHQYAWADALILPSLCEGSAMATYEAKCFGLPVICTPNAGADIRDGVDGLVIAPHSIDAIVTAIERIPDLVVQMSTHRAQMQDPRLSFEIYQRDLQVAIGTLNG